MLPLVLLDVLDGLRSLLPFDDVATFVSQLRLVLFGGLIITFLVVEPLGLARLHYRLQDYFRHWPFSY